MSNVLAKLVGNSQETEKRLSNIETVVNKIYATQVSAAEEARKAEQRRRQDEKRKAADNPLKSLFTKDEKDKKKKDGFWSKLLKILGAIGSGGLGLLKLLGLGGLAKTIQNIFSRKFWFDLFGKGIKGIFGKDGLFAKAWNAAFGKNGWAKKAWTGAFGKGGWARTAWTKAFGKGGWAQNTWTKAFGKGGWASKAIGALGNTGIGKSLTKLLGSISAFFTAGGGKGILGGVKGLFGGISKKLGGKLIPGLGALIEGFTTFQETGDVGQAGAAGGGALAGGLGGAKLGAVIGTMIAPGIGTAIGGFLGGVGGTIIGSELGQGLYKMIAENPAVIAIGDFFKGYFKGVVDTFKETWESFTGMISTIGKALSRFNEEVIGPFFKSIGDFFMNAWETYVNAVKTVTKAITDFVMGAWTNFTGAIKSVTDFIGGVFQPVIETISGFLENTLGPVLDQIQQFLKPIIDPLKQLATVILDPLVKAFETAKNAIQGLISIIPGFGGGTAGEAGEAVGGGVAGIILNPFKNLFDNVNNALSDYAEGGETPEREQPTTPQPKPQAQEEEKEESTSSPARDAITVPQLPQVALPELALPELPGMEEMGEAYKVLESKIPKFPVVDGLPQISFPGADGMVEEVSDINKALKVMLKMESMKDPEAFQKASLGLQTGGIVPGSGTGDIFGPVGLPTGSLVLNRNATAMMGLQTGGVVPTMLEPGEAVFSPGSWSPAMAAMNSVIPRFQTGGVVGEDQLKEGQAANANTQQPAGSKVLKVPYFNQRQNKVDGMGRGGDTQCFSTAAAMVVSAVLGKNITPDEYNKVRVKFGDSTSMGAQTKAMSEFGVPSSGGDNGSYQSYKSAINAGKPVILGLQHNSGGGHMVTGIGYNKDGIVVNDPFGKLNPTPKGGWAQANVSGDNDTKGMGVTYPKSLMDGIWVDRGPGTGRMVTPGKGGVKPGQAAPGDSGDSTGSLSEDSSSDSSSSQTQSQLDALRASVSGLGEVGAGVGAAITAIQEVFAQDEEGKALLAAMGLSVTPAADAASSSDSSSDSGDSGGGGAISSSPGGAFGESALIKAMNDFGMTNKNERAMFLSQMSHETGNFRYDEEIHDGSDYEGRSDLGNNQAGDGKRYKGRGYIQITGRANYKKYGDMVGQDLEKNPELASDPNIAAAVSLAYWKDRVDRDAARRGDVKKVTYNINGGYNGLDDRITKFKNYKGKGLQAGGVVGVPTQGYQTGGVVNMSRVNSPSSARFKKAQEEFASNFKGGGQPVVVTVPMAAPQQAPPTIRSNPSTQTKAPDLPDGPSSVQSAEYFYRLSMGSVL